MSSIIILDPVKTLILSFLAWSQFLLFPSDEQKNRGHQILPQQTIYALPNRSIKSSVYYLMKVVKLFFKR